MMIFVSGDTHGNFRRFSTKRFPQQKQMTRNDYVIILGDFGGVWNDSKEERYWLDWLESKSFTTLWIDGNHENFPLLEQYPRVLFHGGVAHQIRPHIFHLCRSNVFQLNGQAFFVMGGAQSHESLLLSPDFPGFKKQKKRLTRLSIPFRVKGESWWKEELPSITEIINAVRRIKKCNRLEDLIILTHCGPNNIQMELCPNYPYNDLTAFFMELQKHIPYKKWYCGHYHVNRTFPDKRFQVLYDDIIPIE